MRQTMIRKTMDWKTAQDLGYKVSEPKRVSGKLHNLCARLGDEYYLGLVDGGNAICRVIGDERGNSTGWDVEIYPVRSGSDKYNITLWKDYGNQTVHTQEAVKDEDDAIVCSVEMMLHLFAPESVYPTRYNICPRPAE